MKFASLYYRCLVQLYPRDFRRRFGSDMLETFEDYWQGARPVARISFLGRVSLDWIRTAPRLTVKMLARTLRAASRNAGPPSSLPGELLRAGRSLTRQPVVNLMIILSLSVGLGANATMFRTLDALLWSSLPVEDADEVVRIVRFHRDEGAGTSISYPNWQDIAGASTSVFEHVMLQRLETFAIASGGTKAVIHGEVVSSNYFEGLGVDAILGSVFTEQTVEEGVGSVAVISYELWSTRLGGDSTVIGSTVLLNGEPVTIAGVADRSFNGTKLALAMDVWIPLQTWTSINPVWSNTLNERGSRWLNAIARIRDDVSLDEAGAALEVISENLVRDHPENEGAVYRALEERGAVLFPENPGMLGVIGAIGMGAAIMVLLIAAINVVNLMLASATTRRTDTAIRMALGAGRLRILREHVSELAILGVASASVALLMSFLTSRALTGMIPPFSYRLAFDLAPDGRTTAIVALLTIAVVAALGLISAVAATRSSALNDIGSASASRGSTVTSRIPDLLVVAQIAVSVTSLVIGAGFVASLSAAADVDPGVDIENALLVSLDTSLEKFDRAGTLRLITELIDGLTAERAVRAISLTSIVPLGDRSASTGILPAERRFEEGQRDVSAWITSIAGDGLGAVGIELVAGREFTATEMTEPSEDEKAIINLALARQLWPEVAPTEIVGRRVAYGATESTIEVVGVVETSRYRSITESGRPAIFRPFAQRTTTFNTLILQPASVGADQLLPLVREQLARRAPTLPVYSVVAGAEHLDGALWLFRSGGVFAGGMACMALLLAAGGLFGVMTFSIGRRKRELGVRMALGASGGKILRHESRRAVAIVSLGLVGGAIPALLVAKAIESLLFGVTPSDPRIVLAVPTLILIVAAGALWIPLRTACRTDPLIVMRAE